MKQLETLAASALSCGCTVQHDEPMKKHTTFKIGGPADLFLTVPNVDALRTVVTKANELSVPYRVIGRGSNLLVSDGGIRGAVILLPAILRRSPRRAIR